MNNSLYNDFGPKDGMAQFINEINNFKRNFQGDPRAEVEKMMRNGQLSQAQFNEFAQIANQFSRYIK